MAKIRHLMMPTPYSIEGLREGVRALYQRLRGHIDLEDRILAPAIRDTPGFGEIREQQLITRHRVQREALAAHLLALDDLLGPALADRILSFIQEIRDDIREEEQDLLRPDLLSSNLVQAEFGG